MNLIRFGSHTLYRKQPVTKSRSIIHRVLSAMGVVRHA